MLLLKETNIKSGDIIKENIFDLEECAQKCFERPDCAAFTFVIQGLFSKYASSYNKENTTKSNESNVCNHRTEVLAVIFELFYVKSCFWVAKTFC